MNTIKKIIMTIVTLSSFSLGNLSKAQLIELTEMSWMVQSFGLTQEERYTQLFNKFNIDKNTTNLETIENIKKYAYCVESFKAFLDQISELSSEEYADIVSFYYTDVGKKLNQAYLGFKIETANKIYQELEKNKKISEERILLTTSIFKELNLIDLHIYYQLGKLIIEKTLDKKNPKYSNKSLQEYPIKTKTILNKNIKQSAIALFRNFTIDELKKVLEYAKTKGGKREWEVFFKGLEEAYMHQLYSCGKYYYKLENLTSTSHLKK